jgi:methionyl-tRNA formyltransferase
MRNTQSAVKARALERGLEVAQPSSLRDEVVLTQLRALRADAMIVAAYGQLLPPAALECAAHGAINIHASLLPRWRGAAPIQRALLGGDRETGVSIMRMDAGLDTGPVYLRRPLAIGSGDDFGVLHDKLADLGAEALLQVLGDIATGSASAQAQPAEGATYARKIEKHETWLDWRRPAEELERAVRAFRPTPGAAARLGGEVLKLWRCRVLPGTAEPGTVVEGEPELHVACGSGVLAIDELQAAGGRRMPAGEFLRGRAIARGARFDLG